MSANTPAPQEDTPQWGPCCPEWAVNFQDLSQCTIVPLVGGGFGALDHGIQTLIFTAKTREEVKRYLGSHADLKDEDDL